MNIIDWNALDADAQARALTRPAQAVAAQTRAAVEALIGQVREGGDAALRDITARLDGVALERFEVSEAEFAAAEQAVPAELRIAMQQAAEDDAPHAKVVKRMTKDEAVQLSMQVGTAKMVVGGSVDGRGPIRCKCK